MKYNATNINDYIEELPGDRKIIIEKLRLIIQGNLPIGFKEVFYYGMICYVVPLSVYPNGYHAKKGEPLLFLALASQKNHIALYHMGIYMNQDVYAWFTIEYAKQVKSKLDMGKSCIRFKKMEQIPFELIGELCKKISIGDYIKAYEESSIFMKIK